MPLASPLHPRTWPLCQSYRWTERAGYHAVRVYGSSVAHEYHALRRGVGLFDATPGGRYEIGGPEAAALLSHVTVRDLAALAPGRMTRLCWCDDRGKVLDEGSCANLGDGRYRLASIAPALGWLGEHARAFDVTIADVSREQAVLALYGPAARALLGARCEAELDGLERYDVKAVVIAGGGGWLSRTDHPCAPGYELTVPSEQALAAWDALVDEGRRSALAVVGLDALEIARIEAGIARRGIDYQGASEALGDVYRATPFEIGLGPAVELDGRGFVGERALREASRAGSRWALVGLEIDWPSLVALSAIHRLPPEAPTMPWHAAVPIYHEGRQVGRATSGVWSPMLARSLALATVEADLGRVGTELFIEWTVAWARQTLPARVVATPFFDSERTLDR